MGEASRRKKTGNIHKGGSWKGSRLHLSHARWYIIPGKLHGRGHGKRKKNKSN